MRTRSHPEMVGDVACDLQLWPIKNSFCAFLAKGQDLYSHQKLNMYIYWFSSKSGYRRQRRQRRTPQYMSVQPLGRHIANQTQKKTESSYVLFVEIK